ncbi:MAG TPA: phosphomannose isomerase type II C-terminal cupin domain [Candidatus Baltobacteraceae bacterium]|nr:phosphomannose isomerase type II C-terminal cupin domain [Candidatus Baltobacteraceae bacterium]
MTPPSSTAGVRSRPILFERRPWGSFATLEEGPGYKVKRLAVMPGQRLSLQKHQYRSEHWVVVAGVATVVNGPRTLQLGPRDSTVIPRRGWHRIENRGRDVVVIIEVQHGTRLEESDIIRKEDDYGRVPMAGRARSAEPHEELGARRDPRSTGPGSRPVGRRP